MRRVIAWADMQMQLKVYGVCMIPCLVLGFKGSIGGCRGDNVSKLLSTDVVYGYINQIKSIKRKLKGKKHMEGQRYTRPLTTPPGPCVIVSGCT